MVSQTWLRVVRFNSCKGPVYPGKGPKKSQRTKGNCGASKCYLQGRTGHLSIWTIPGGPQTLS